MQGGGQNSDASSWDLWRCQLCSHGPDHGRRRPDCRFAHSLCELRRPDESRHSYANQWTLGRVDRFYGQRLSPDQIERIKYYYVRTKTCDLPLWAIGLSLIFRGLECRAGYAYPWDFGLIKDYDELKELRVDRIFPMSEFSGLWRRLHDRRTFLVGYRHPPHLLGVNEPEPAPAPPPSSAIEAGAEALPAVATVIAAITEDSTASSSNLAPISAVPISGESEEAISVSAAVPIGGESVDAISVSAAVPIGGESEDAPVSDLVAPITGESEGVIVGAPITGVAGDAPGTDRRNESIVFPERVLFLSPLPPDAPDPPAHPDDIPEGPAVPMPSFSRIDV